MASPAANRDEEGNASSTVPNSENQSFDLKFKDIEKECTTTEFAGTEIVSIPSEHGDDALPKLEKVNEIQAAKSASKPAQKRKKIASKMKSRRYPLRSSIGGGRVLRSMSKSNAKPEPDPIDTPVNPVTKRRKKRRKTVRASNDDFAVIRKRVRYLLTRMNYEQNLIDAYSGEGWKGQSAEKIKPEKELERAKTEILRCKFRIRELFRHLDTLSSEGRYEDSLFDSEGEIDSEDIYCAKCSLKDLSTDNDIILCDGICNRGFHQKCLNPPLLSEDIPVGDEGWLCPACDCKVDCLDLLDEFRGSNLTIKDKWQKVFPEAGSVSNGDNQHDGLPSDDSEDYDYDPDGREVDGQDQEESEFNSSSESSDESSDASNKNEKTENLGLPSDDSEDDDYNPDAPDLDTNIQKDEMSSNESDFTSDSDEFCNELRKSSGANKDTASSLPNAKPSSLSDDEGAARGMNNTDLSMPETDLNQENVLLSNRRQVDRLDYKKLYDEAYAKSSSDSSDDEDWFETSDMSTPNGGKKSAKRKESNGLSKANGRIVKNHKKSGNSAAQPTEVDTIIKSDVNKSEDFQVHKTTPQRPHQPLNSSTPEHEVAARNHGSQELDCGADRSNGSVNRRLGEIATQKLHESFLENQYPSREKKESLAQELALTYRQVDKWFVNARHSHRVSSKEVLYARSPTPKRENSVKPTTAETDETPDVDTVKSSQSNANKRKKSAPAKKTAKKTKGGGESSADRGSTDAVDKERQKAIARELRKMKQGR